MSSQGPPRGGKVLPAFATLPVDASRPSRNEKNPDQKPIVTIFGAGIAGLSAAHELIEKGFDVQVVEPARSPDEEYAAEAGGMARNQFGRIPEDPRILHGPEPVGEKPIEWSFRVLFQPGTNSISDKGATLRIALDDLLYKLEARTDELAAEEANKR